MPVQVDNFLNHEISRSNLSKIIVTYDLKGNYLLHIKRNEE